MTHLYNCKHRGDQYQISKFDENMDVLSTYTCTELECDCPAGVRPTCRHRQMLPKFIRRGFVNTCYLYDYDRDGWVQSDLGEALSESASEPTIATYIELAPDADVAEEFSKLRSTGSVDTAGTTTGRATANTATFEDVAPRLPQMTAQRNLQLENERVEQCDTPTKPFRRGL